MKLFYQLMNVFNNLFVVPARITVTSPLVARGLKSTSVDLFCSTSGTPVLKLKWFKNGLIISTENHLKYFSYQSQGHETQPPTLNSSLEIRNLIQTDTGNYECMATNAYGSQNTRFEVYVEGTKKIIRKDFVHGRIKY